MATGLRALLLMASLHALHCFSKPGLHLARRNAAVAPRRAPISASIGEVAFAEHMKQAAVDVVQGVGAGRCVPIVGLGVSEMTVHGCCRATNPVHKRVRICARRPPAFVARALSARRCKDRTQAMRAFATSTLHVRTIRAYTHDTGIVSMSLLV